MHRGDRPTGMRRRRDAARAGRCARRASARSSRQRGAPSAMALMVAAFHEYPNSTGRAASVALTPALHRRAARGDRTRRPGRDRPASSPRPRPAPGPCGAHPQRQEEHDDEPERLHAQLRPAHWRLPVLRRHDLADILPTPTGDTRDPGVQLVTAMRASSTRRATARAGSVGSAHAAARRRRSTRARSAGVSRTRCSSSAPRT